MAPNLTRSLICNGELMQEDSEEDSKEDSEKDSEKDWEKDQEESNRCYGLGSVGK